MFCWLRLTGDLCVVIVGVFRGKVWDDPSYLQNCLSIITRIVQLQVMASPLRSHVNLLDDPLPVEDKVESVDGLLIGRVIDIRGVDGHIRGPVMNADDTDPGDVGIDSGFSFEDFSRGPYRLCCFVLL